MRSVLRWVARTVSKTANAAVQGLLRGIIRRFLEEPIADDALSLELFEDWTIHMKLHQVFLDVRLVNNYVPKVSFQSVYVSDLKFDAGYNLSNFRIDIKRVLLELDLQEEHEVRPEDEELAASIHEFAEHLPMER